MRLSARDIAYIGVGAASLTAVKLALSWIANVELVTLFLVFYTLVLGKNRAFFICNIFIAVEITIYGIGAWTISYLIHWNAVVVLTWFLQKKGVKKGIVYALFLTLLTLLFGVQTTIVETLIYSPLTHFFSAVGLRYFMGLSFFATHVASSFLSITFLLPLLLKIPLSKLNRE